MLTIIALVAFVMIGGLPYLQLSPGYDGLGHPAYFPIIEDVRLPFFMLGVIYAAFFLLADKEEKR